MKIKVYSLSSTTWTWALVKEVEEKEFVKDFEGFHEIHTVEGGIYTSRSEIYNIAFVGKGSSIAYYLETLGAPYLSPPGGTSIYGKALVTRPARSVRAVQKNPGVLFGHVDEWDKEVRGAGFINHEKHEIGHWGTTVPEFGTDYMSRADFAAENKAIFDRAGGVDVNLVDVEVIKKKGDVFELTTVEGDTFHALKVVVGTGAGPHQRPDTMHVLEGAEGRVLDLDAFMRRCPLPGHEADRVGDSLGPTEGVTIVVNGANAGIDAVERAAACGYQVIWLIGTTKPVLLGGNRLERAPEIAKSAISVHYDVVIAPVSGGVTVTCVPQQSGGDKTEAPKGKIAKNVLEHPKKRDISAAYYVYAVGQDPMAAGAVGDVLMTKGGLGWGDFEPIYDMNQIFGAPYETVLGLRTKGSSYSRGLEIIGAAATSLAAFRGNKLAHDFIEQLPEGTDTRDSTQITLGAHVDGKKLAARSDVRGMSAKELGQRTRFLQRQLANNARSYLSDDKNTIARLMNRVVEKEIASVVLMAQLVGLKASIAAINGMIPAYVAEGNGANFNIDNRTMLRVYLAHRYPDMEEEHAQRWIEYIVNHRRSDDHPLGFDESWTALFEKWFKEWDEFGKRYAR